jgi:ribosomal protein S1/Tfp pilus assembly protein PilF
MRSDRFVEEALEAAIVPAVGTCARLSWQSRGPAFWIEVDTAPVFFDGQHGAIVPSWEDLSRECCSGSAPAGPCECASAGAPSGSPVRSTSRWLCRSRHELQTKPLADQRLFGSSSTKAMMQESSSSPGMERKKRQREPTEVASLPKAKVVEPLPGAPNPLRADTLSFTSLAPGMSVLGVVRDVGSSAIKVSLPSGLTASVPVELTNDTIASKWAAMHDSRERDSLLSGLFKPGMVVRAVVQSSEAGKGKKRITLSLRPGDVSQGLELSHVGIGAVMGGVIRSLEDHGYTVDCGVSGVRAFLPFRATDGTDGQGNPLLEGSPFVAAVVTECVLDTGAGSATVSLALDVTTSRRHVRVAPVTAQNLSKADHVDDDADEGSSARGPAASVGMTSLLAGDRVNALVQRVLPNGLLVRLDGRGGLSALNATVGLSHLHDPASATWAKAYSRGQRLTGRVLFVDAAAGKIGLSLAPHLVELRAPPCAGNVFGSVLEHAVVVRVDPKVGVVMAWGKNPHKSVLDAKAGPDEDEDSEDDEPSKGKKRDLSSRLRTISKWGRVGFAHVSRLADSRVESVMEAFPVGSEHKARVVGFWECDGVPSLSLQPSVVTAGVVSASQLQPGDLVEGVVERDTPRGKAVKLRIGGSAIGVVTPLHVSDSSTNPPKDPELRKKWEASSTKIRFRAGQKVRGRVLGAARPGSVFVTLKSSLVKMNGLPVVKSVEDAAKLADALYAARRAVSSGKSKEDALESADALTTRGFVTMLRPGSGVIVTMFDGLHGLIPASVLAKSGVIPTVESPLEPAFFVGQVVTVTVRRATGKGSIVLDLADHHSGGVLGSPGLSFAPPEWAECIQEGSALFGRAVAAEALLAGKPFLHEKEDTKGLEPILFQWTPPGSEGDGASLWAHIPDECLADDLSTARRLASAIRAAGPTGIAIQGVIPLFASKAPLMCRLWPREGTSKAETVKTWAVATRKPSLVHCVKTPEMGILLPQRLEDLVVGTIVVGVASGATDAGIFVTCRNRLTGFVPVSRLPRDCSPSEIVLGSTVFAVVKTIDPETRRLVLDMRPVNVSACAKGSEAGVLSFETALAHGLIGDDETGALLEVAVGANDDEEEEEDEEDEEDEEEEDEEEEEEDSGDDNADDEEEEDSDEDVDSARIRRADVVPGSLVVGEITEAAASGGFHVSLTIDDAQIPGYAPLSTVVSEGPVLCRVLDVDTVTGVVDVVPVASAPSSSKALAKALQADSRVVRAQCKKLSSGMRVAASVLLMKHDRYAVCSIGSGDPSHPVLAVMPLISLVVPGAHEEHIKVGATLDTCVLASPPTPGDEWNAKSMAVLSNIFSRNEPLAEGSAHPRRPRSDSIVSVTAAAGPQPVKSLQQGQLLSAIITGFAPPKKSSGCGVIASACDVLLQLRHVSGKVSARMSLADLVSSSESGPSELANALSWKAGNRVVVRVLRIWSDGRTRQVQVSGRSADLPPAVVAAIIRASGSQAPPVNLVIPSSSLSGAEDSIDDSERVLSLALEASFSPSEFLPARSWVSEAPKEGWIGHGVVEAIDTERGVIIGFGSGVRGVASFFDACEDLASAQSIATTFPVGSTVPVGILSCQWSPTHPSKRTGPTLVLVARPSTIKAARAAGRAAPSASRETAQLEEMHRRHRLMAPGTVVFGRVVEPHTHTAAGVATIAELARSFSMAESAGNAPATEASPSAGRVSLSLYIAPRFSGSVDVCEAADRDSWRHNPFDSLQGGSFVQAALLSRSEYIPSHDAKDDSDQDSESEEDSEEEAAVAAPVRSALPRTHAQLSMRAEYLGLAAKGGLSAKKLSSLASKEDAAILTQGAVVRGFVNATSRKGCFLRLSSRVTGRVLVSNLSDSFVQDPASAFPPGRVVQGVVTKVDSAQNRVDVSLRPSALRAAGVSVDSTPAEDPLEGLEVGAVVAGKISRVTDFGIFVSLPGGLRGLCHKSNLPFEAKAPGQARRRHATKSTVMPLSAFSVGDAVTVRIDKVNQEERKVSLTMRFDDPLPSAPHERPATSSSSTGRATEEVPHDSDGESSEEEPDSEDDEEEEEEREDQDDREDSDEEESSAKRMKPAFDVSFGISSKDLESGVPPRATSSASSAAIAAASSALAAFQLLSSISSHDPSLAEPTQEGGANGSSSRATSKKRLSKKDRERLETEAAARETAIAEGRNVLHTAADFERLIGSDPHSSVSWIRLMAFHVAHAAIDDARATAERALSTISFRNETDRLNLWVAMLNLEATYGTAESLGGVFSRAVKANDPLRTHRAMLDIYRKLGRAAEAETLFRVTLKKFRPHIPTWRDFCEFQLRGNRPQDARATLKSALEAMEPKERPDFTKDFAVLEYKYGSAQRGRTMFEDLIAAHPKRLDIWLVYVDQEARAGNITIARGIMDRLVAAGGLSSKKVRSVFKKWALFESEHGDAASMAALKKRVAEYVSAQGE